MRTKTKSRILIWALGVGVMVVFVASAFAQDDPVVEEPLPDEELLMPPEEPQMPGTIEGTGTYFEVTDSEYLNIALASTEPVNLRLESVPQMVVIHIEAAEGAASTQITLSGFEPSTTYYKYQDDYHNEVAFTTDAGGNYSFSQDLAIGHLVFIQPQPGTMYIPPHSEDPQWWKDWWDGTTLTLQADVSGTIQIDADGVTLDGQGHMVGGGSWGTGVHLPGRKGVTIKNLIVKTFSYGIVVYRGSDNTLTYNTTTLHRAFGIYLWSSSNNTLAGNTAWNNMCGIWLQHCNNNTLTDNTANLNSLIGICLRLCNNNTLTDNTANLNSSIGISLEYECSGNTLTGNTTSDNGNGICQSVGCGNNTISGNRVSGNYWSGIYTARQCNNNTISDNTVSGNDWGILIKEQCSSNIITGNTVSENATLGIRLDGVSDNEVYNNNFIANPTQACVYGGIGGVFNLEKPIGGNYWNNWTTPDDDGDGFVDNWYVFTGGQDELPWTRQDGWLNQPPQVTLTSPASGLVAAVGQEILFEGAVADPDIGDTHTGTWTISSDYGVEEYDASIDGTTIADAIEFLQAGIYSIKLTVTDAAGASDEATTVNDDPESPAFIVIYDPDGGFVTGGGWIYSPAGALLDSATEGKASFGFVAKYKKGATVPQGNTEFRFQAGDFRFKSSSYDWLVIAGTKAMFKGEGSIDGMGEGFKFMLTAVDDDNSGDRFRIKIWDETTEPELVIYDNKRGEGDDAEPTIIGGGSIVIHKN